MLIRIVCLVNIKKMRDLYTDINLVDIAILIYVSNNLGKAG